MLSTTTFRAMGVINTVAVEDAARLARAYAIARETISEIDAACSRFREDSELCELNRRAGQGYVRLSGVMEGALVAALRTAEITGGLVDPTVGRIVQELGYTVTFGSMPADGPAVEIRARTAAGWRCLAYDPAAHTLGLPGGVALDLGASGKAWAADRAAEAVAELLGIGVLVECGGDIAVRGPAPVDAWPVRIAEDIGADGWVDVIVRDGGLATSGTTSRRWRRGGVELHDIIDPATGRPAQTPWRMVTVAAATCVDANAAATASLVMGDRAVAWLDDLNLPARLVRTDGGVRYAGGWAA